MVDPSSPTGLRWRDDVKRFENNSRGGNCWGGTPAFKMAVEFRLNGIKKMNEQHNFKYTDRHIGVGI